tara:strand:- start:123 stop:236 length:114 start_codon:yes stop_codon:yes gene_type:complete
MNNSGEKNKEFLRELKYGFSLGKKYFTGQVKLTRKIS